MASMLNGKSFTITGAGSGIGRSIAMACAAEGANLCLSGRQLSKVEEVAALIAEVGGAGRIIAVEADITSADSLTGMYRQAVENFSVLDGIVANAGIIAPSPPVPEFREEDWRRAIETNVMGAVMTVSFGARILVEQGRGGIVLATGSSTALKVGRSMASYAASKAAMHAFMDVAALDLAPHGIRVNTLVPGPSITPPLQQMEGFLDRVASTLPLQDPVTPDELGRYAAFALSGALPHMTGAKLVVDSGRTIS